MGKSKWDYLGKSTDDKSKLPFFDIHNVDGTTFFEVDTFKLWIYYQGEWYDGEAA